MFAPGQHLQASFLKISSVLQLPAAVVLLIKALKF
jgi:hypothetical protein